MKLKAGESRRKKVSRKKSSQQPKPQPSRRRNPPAAKKKPAKKKKTRARQPAAARDSSRPEGGKAGPHSEGIAAALRGLANAKHEAFAQHVARGLTAAAAYRAVNGGQQTAGTHQMASRLLRKVQVRVKELQAASATATTLTMQERREFIAKLIRTPMSLIDEHNPLCQSVKYIESETGRRVEYKVADKLAAIMGDAKLSGELVEKVEHAGEVRMPMTLAEFEKRVEMAGA